MLSFKQYCAYFSEAADEEVESIGKEVHEAIKNHPQLHKYFDHTTRQSERNTKYPTMIGSFFKGKSPHSGELTHTYDPKRSKGMEHHVLIMHKTKTPSGKLETRGSMAFGKTAAEALHNTHQKYQAAFTHYQDVKQKSLERAKKKGDKIDIARKQRNLEDHNSLELK